MRKIIITGGCGYIGSHVARAFKLNGDEVFIIDRVYREHTLKNIDGYFIDDFASEASLATIVDVAPDVIVHCAGTSLVGPSMGNPSEYYDNNIAKTIKMLSLVKDLPKIPSIMFSSSASVYGEPSTVPVAEGAAIRPLSPYGNSKAMTETILSDFFRAYQLPSMSFRYFNAAGAEPFNFDLGQEPKATHIIARVLEASLAGQAFTLYGSDYPTPDGSCIRDYIHVWDLAVAHIKGADYLTNHPGSYTFNLGTNIGVSNFDIVGYVTKRYGLAQLIVEDRRWGDPAQLVADARWAQRELDWRPNYSDLENIIDSAYKWYAGR